MKINIKENRFYIDNIKINGSWAIFDRLNEDDTIWICCEKKYLDCIVDALNKQVKN